MTREKTKTYTAEFRESAVKLATESYLSSFFGALL